MEPLSAREQRKLQDEIARQEKQERVAGQQRLVREGQLQKQQKRQQEMLQHQQSQGHWLSHLETAPTFYPTPDEFQDPIAYIRSIQTEGSKHGICKIVPPFIPTVPSGLVLEKPDGSKFSFSTREQVVQQLKWETLDTARFFDSGKTYNIKDYERFADDFQRRRFGLAGCLPAKMVEADYWRQMCGNDNPVVEYGNDVEGTAFCPPDAEDPLGSTGWNLQVLPHVAQSTLRLLRGDAPGVSSPMLYIGMLFATFAWHVEDHYLYSINYQHLGAAKTWYGVPASDADAFEAVARKHVYTEAVAAALAEGKSEAEVAAAVHAALLGKTTMFTPKLLTDNGVLVTRVVQAPGEYVITFPRAYHGGFSNGFCIGEAVNFSIGDWFPFGLDAAQRYRRLSRLPILAHDELLCLEGLAIHDEIDSATWQQQPQADMHATLMHCFLQLIREQHAQRAQLAKRGHTQALRLPFSASMPCCRCKGMMYLAEVVSGDDWTVPVCLACALAHPPQTSAPLRIQIHPDVAHLETVAQSFEQLLRQPNNCLDTSAAREQGLDTSGLTETANFGLPDGSLDTGSPLDPFDWATAPPLPQPDPQEDPHLEPGECSAGSAVPEELVACQRDAPEPLKVTPTRSGHRNGRAAAVRGPEPAPRAPPGAHTKAASSSGKTNTNSDGQPPQLLPTCHSCGEELADAERLQGTATLCPGCEQSRNPRRPNRAQSSNPEDSFPSSTHFPAILPGRSLNPKILSGKRTPRKRNLSSLDQDVVDTLLEARGHVRGAKEMSRGGSTTAREQSKARHLNGLQENDADTWSGASGERPQGRGLGKRPSGKWTKLGSDADSPPGKRAKTQVPGVKAANGTYIPPGPMLNSASTRLACLEDVEIDVSGPGAPHHLFRRRVFAPEDNRNERYLTASDVVKGSGFETNTSASNIIDRWTREACAIIVRHNNRNSTDLPMPELPARAYCAGMASSCYVLKAVDVEMLMLPGVLKEDLRDNLQRFICDVWPRSAYPTPRALPAQPPPREAPRPNRAGSRPSSAQPQALPSGTTRFSRYDPEADTTARGRASGSRADPTWGRASAEGAGQQRVLRRRDPRGHGSVKHARHDVWRDKDTEQLGTGASQGLDVLAGLAESALSEENGGWDLTDPPPHDMDPQADEGQASAPQPYSQPPPQGPAQTHPYNGASDDQPGQGQGRFPAQPPSYAQPVQRFGTAHSQGQVASPAQCNEAQLPGQLQAQRPAASMSMSDGIIRPQAVRSQGFTLHRGHQLGPAGQLQTLPALPSASLGPTAPQSMALGPSAPQISSPRSQPTPALGFQPVRPGPYNPKGSALGYLPAESAESNGVQAPEALSSDGAPGQAATSPTKNGPQPSVPGHMLQQYPLLGALPKDLNWPPSNGFAAQLHSLRAAQSGPLAAAPDGAKLTLEQLYYTLEHVGKSLPEDKYEALSMMIRQLTDCGEKYEARA
ncbi:hypothetical protein WJX82_002859 [Trebouxia sp. C0006]